MTFRLGQPRLGTLSKQTERGLSPWHIEIHVRSITKKSQQAGYHGGLTLNSLAAYMGEPYQRVLDVLDTMAANKNARPFGCAITRSPVWYVRGISKNFKYIDDLIDYGYSRNTTTRFQSYTDVYNEARTLAERYPNMGFDDQGMPTVASLVDMRARLGLPIVLTQMTDLDCLLCQDGNDVPPPPVPHGPAAADFLEDAEDDDDDDDPDDFDDQEEAPF